MLVPLYETLRERYRFANAMGYATLTQVNQATQEGWGFNLPRDIRILSPTSDEVSNLY